MRAMLVFVLLVTGGTAAAVAEESPGAVSALAVSNDDSRFFVARWDGGIDAYAVSTESRSAGGVTSDRFCRVDATLLRSFRTHTQTVSGLAVAGDHLLSGDIGGKLALSSVSALNTTTATLWIDEGHGFGALLASVVAKTFVAVSQTPVRSIGCVSPGEGAAPDTSPLHWVRILDLASGTHLRKLGPFDEDQVCLALSADGLSLFAGSSSGRVRVWRTSDWTVLSDFQTKLTPVSMCPLDSGAVVLLGQHGEIGAFGQDGSRTDLAKEHASRPRTSGFSGGVTTWNVHDACFRTYEIPSLNVTRTGPAVVDEAEAVWLVASSSRLTVLGSRRGKVQVFVAGDQ